MSTDYAFLDGFDGPDGATAEKKVGLVLFGIAGAKPAFVNISDSP
jgi:nicotinamide mononucleotide (NMN) deamidase PncC